MIKKLLTTVLPFIAPFIAYAIYVVITRRWTRQGKRWQDAPWYWLATAGLACVIVSLGAFALLGGAEPGSTYHPAVLKDGKVIPGHFE